MLIGLDATPLLGPRSGIGRYVAELVRHLPEGLPGGDELVTTAFTLRGRNQLSDELPPGVSCRVRPIPARLLQELWARTEMPRVGLLTGRVDVFHGTNFVLPPPGRAAGVVTVHDLAYLRMRGTVSAASRRYADLVPRALRRAGAVCVPSHQIAGELQEAYPLAGDRVVVTPLGVAPEWHDARRPTPQELASIGLRTPYLLFVGTLEPRKDVRTLLSALRILHDRKHPDVPALALVGGAGWGEALDLSGFPEGAVVVLGRQPEGRLPRLVAGARALVYPSLYEGFGLPLLEAFACGTPVVASDIPTTREVLSGAEDLARLFPAGDAGALAELLATWEPDAPGAEARRRAHAAARTWAATAEATRQAYRLALG